MADGGLPHRVKICIKCQQELPVTTEFFYADPTGRDGFLRRCKECHKALGRERHAQNRDQRLIANRIRYQANKERILATQKLYYERNKQRIAEQGREYRARNQEAIRARRARYKEQSHNNILESNRRNYRRLKAAGRQYEWRDANREKAREYHREYCKKWLSSGKRRVCHTIAVLMGRSLRRGKDGYSWEKLVGYRRAELVRHIERQFIKGMSWDNFGEWHIDHILPVAMFDFERPEDDGFKACWALTNLRPFWGIENMSKGDKRLHLI